MAPWTDVCRPQNLLYPGPHDWGSRWKGLTKKRPALLPNVGALRVGSEEPRTRGFRVPRVGDRACDLLVDQLRHTVFGRRTCRGDAYGHRHAVVVRHLGTPSKGHGKPKCIADKKQHSAELYLPKNHSPREGLLFVAKNKVSIIVAVKFNDQKIAFNVDLPSPSLAQNRQYRDAVTCLPTHPEQELSPLRSSEQYVP